MRAYWAPHTLSHVAASRRAPQRPQPIMDQQIVGQLLGQNVALAHPEGLGPVAAGINHATSRAAAR